VTNHCPLARDLHAQAAHLAGNSLVVAAPGVSAKDLSVTMVGGVLKVTGKTVRASRTHTCNHKYLLPKDVDPNALTASLSDGILTINLPKKKVAGGEARRIPVVGQGDFEESSDGDEPSSRYTVRLACPGLSAKEIQVTAKDRVLKATGSNASTCLCKVFSVPRDADVAEARACAIDGILTVTLPKMAAAPEARNIEVTTSTPTAAQVPLVGAAGGRVPRSPGSGAEPAATGEPATEVVPTPSSPEDRVLDSKAAELLLELDEERTTAEEQEGKPTTEGARAALAAMGFTDASMVGFVIDKYGAADVNACARDLAAVSEWDTLLDDLAEMGFADRTLNKIVMLKHDGDVKRAVRALVEESRLSKLESSNATSEKGDGVQGRGSADEEEDAVMV